MSKFLHMQKEPIVNINLCINESIFKMYQGGIWLARAGPDRLIRRQPPTYHLPMPLNAP